MLKNLHPRSPGSEFTLQSSTAIVETADRHRRSVFTALLVLAGLAVPLFFVGIGRVALLDPDEPYYAVPAYEMLQRGIWSFPILHGQPWFDKPVLFYWVILAAFKLFGISEFAARIGSSLAALGGVLAIFAYSLRRSSPGSRTPLLTAVILATSLEYAVVARSVVTDMTLTLFLTLGMLAAARFLEEERARWMLWAGICFGLAVLTKGPVGLLVPAFALTGYAALARRRSLFLPRALGAAAAGFLAAAGPWYLYTALAHRDLLVATFLGQGNLGRFLTAEHRSMPFFYVAVLGAGLLPWSGALPSALISAARAFPRGERSGPGKNAAPLFALCWFASVVLIFSVSASKLSTYVLPAFPPAALLLGAYWSRAFDDPRSRRWYRRGMFPAAAGIVAGALVTVIAAARPEPFDIASWIVRAGVLLLVGGSLLAMLFVGVRRFGAFLTVQSLTSVGIVMLFVFFAAPGLERTRSTRPLVRELQERGLDTEVIGAYRERDFSLDFYLGRTLPRAVDRRSLEKAVADRPGGIWMIPAVNLEQITSNRKLTVEALASTPSCAAVRLTLAAPLAEEETETGAARASKDTQGTPVARDKTQSAPLTPGDPQASPMALKETQGAPPARSEAGTHHAHARSSERPSGRHEFHHGSQDGPATNHSRNLQEKPPASPVMDPSDAAARSAAGSPAVDPGTPSTRRDR